MSCIDYMDIVELTDWIEHTIDYPNGRSSYIQLSAGERGKVVECNQDEYLIEFNWKIICRIPGNILKVVGYV